MVTDRYVDSSLAYQGAGRELKVAEIAEVNRWATGGLMPDLTIILDVPSDVGLAPVRLAGRPASSPSRGSSTSGSAAGSARWPTPSRTATW